MRNKYAAVLDFGSSNITVLLGEHGVNNNFKILGSGQADYAGFMDGEFLQPNTLKASIQSAIEKAEEGFGDKIKTLYIGVPSDFCIIHEVDTEIAFGKRVCVTEKHLDKLFAKVNGSLDSQSMLVSVSPMYYLLDDGNRVNNALGIYTTSLRARVSMVFVENKFVHMISSIMQECGNIDFELVCSMLAENLYLLEPDKRSVGAVLVDCGYITTSASFVCGEGLSDLSSFSLGGGFITGDLSNSLNLSFAEAEQLKRKLILSIDATELDYYELYVGGDHMEKVHAKTANDVALLSIDNIIQGIKSCLEQFTSKLDEGEPIYLTGGGLSYLKGAKAYISNAIGRKIEIVKPKSLQYMQPELSSVISLLNFALMK